MRKLFWIAGAVAALVAPSVMAEGNAARGGSHYRTHCATCHGNEATGFGPMASVLIIKPTDLTRLSAENGGVFPTARVVKRIDGRDPLVSHGSPMPVYGFFFEGEDQALKAENGQPIMTSGAIVDLVAFLNSIQEQ